MNKRVTAALAATLLAVVGVVMLINYASAADDRAFNGATLDEVLQVSAPVAANTKAEDLASKVKTVKLPRSAIAEGAITDLDEVAGLATTIGFEPGEQLLESRFSKAGSKPTKSKTAVPKGMQEMTLPLEFERAVGGTLKVGDTIGIVASFDPEEGSSFTSLVLNRVLIVGLDKGVVVKGDKTGDAQMITVAVKANAVNQIAHSLDFGEVRLTRQNADTDTAGIRTIKGGDVSP